MHNSTHTFILFLGTQTQGEDGFLPPPTPPYLIPSLFHWKCNFAMNPHFRPSVGFLLDGRSICRRSVLKVPKRSGKLHFQRSYRCTRYFLSPPFALSVHLSFNIYLSINLNICLQYHTMKLTTINLNPTPSLISGIF